MEKRYIVLLAIVLVVVLSSVIARLFFFNTYTNFDVYTAEISGVQGEAEHHYEECTCFGFLSVMESHPPIHDCRGIESCQDINETR